jgi:hypothetical protein
MRNFIDIFENNDSSKLIIEIIKGRLESDGKSGIEESHIASAADQIAEMDNPSREDINAIVESIQADEGLNEGSVRETVKGICDLIGI